MTEEKPHEPVEDVPGLVDLVAETTKNPQLKEVAKRVRDFETRWDTGSKKK